jgi:hypothetical protein
MYFADMDATSELDWWDWRYLVGTIKYVRFGSLGKVEKAAGLPFPLDSSGE